MENLVSLFEQLRNVYGGKKVFLTGHTGFKGSWLLKMLVLIGADVKGYSLAPVTADDHYCLLNGDLLCKSVIADIRNREQLIAEITGYNPDFIFHLAAQPLVRLSYEIPAETFAVNAIGTANVLDAMRLLDRSCFAICITTDKVYHNNEWLYPYRETDMLGGFDPYSASKACSELVIDSYRNSFFNTAAFQTHRKAVAVARAGNVIGGGDWAKDRLLPDIARALGNGQTIIVRNPRAVRPWQHVLEPLAGYLRLGAALSQDPVAFSSAFNFGPLHNDAMTVEEMVKLAVIKWGEGAYESVSSADQPHEAGLLKLDISKARNLLHWEPEMTASNAVAATVEWYRLFYKDKNLTSFITEQQILAFLLQAT